MTTKPKTDPADDDQTDGKPTETPGTPDGADTPEQPSEADDGQAEGQEDTTGDDEPVRKLRREAQNLRQRAKDAEAKVTELTDRLAAVDQSMVAAALDPTGVSPAVFNRAGPPLDELRDESGVIDLGKVTAAAEALKAEFGIRPGPQPNPQQGTPSQRRAANTLAEAFTGRRR
ncbi:hypothetical protein [Mycolicibacterium fallax]|uniref:Uncharacterized protein n=1 Tax=Mycolicibacterium fallax TaxID=1793 RepID=A0A1X1RFY2_MYCFA|nr:hypothetical protein [Mycolicibacterium fallax]ORV04600.1 hypothetical protein AWC04_08380 [Mycolicibacterium fallax]BBY99656.1 hypothetical protein MFAL_31230 [Mycolicibacterium fallax]